MDKKQQEFLWQRRKQIHEIGEEWKYLESVDLEHTLLVLQREWKGKSAAAFLQKGLELKEAMEKTSEYLLEI